MAFSENTRKELLYLKAALDNILKGGSFVVSIPANAEMKDEEIMKALAENMDMFSRNFNELHTFVKELNQGNLDADLPGRRNYLAAPLKELHSQLSTLAWNMGQLAAGKMAGKLNYPGVLFDAYNKLLTQASEGGFNPDQGGPNSANSWRYHQLLSALNNLHIMVLEVSLDYRIIYANKPASNYFGAIKNIKNAQKDALSAYFLSFEDNTYTFPVFKEIFNESTNSWYKITTDSVEFLDGNVGHLHMVDDISEWKRHENTLKQSASTDPMTGVSNRRAGMRALESALFSETENSCLAFADINRLKYVNDTFGHTEGDYTIKTIANVLNDSVRDKDNVCRYGGDEFMLVFTQCDVKHAEAAVARMYAKLAEVNLANPTPYPISFSYGIIDITANRDKDPAELIGMVDEKMYANKRAMKAAEAAVAGVPAEDMPH
ncbi:MAG: sensor domain-containing diguanylate cyclase [Clostridiales bacterium]|jgi:diguanylate cyclase (GGDEF)-like protein|nr:sensor domain-containing diguanylate cyclase [Clostridiales bacterium]